MSFIYHEKNSLHSKRFQRSSSELFFRPRENRASAKKDGGGRGGEEKVTLADKHHDFENSR